MNGTHRYHKLVCARTHWRNCKSSKLPRFKIALDGFCLRISTKLNLAGRCALRFCWPKLVSLGKANSNEIAEEDRETGICATLWIVAGAEQLSWSSARMMFMSLMWKQAQLLELKHTAQQIGMCIFAQRDLLEVGMEYKRIEENELAVVN